MTMETTNPNLHGNTIPEPTANGPQRVERDGKSLAEYIEALEMSNRTLIAQNRRSMGLLLQIQELIENGLIKNQ